VITEATARRAECAISRYVSHHVPASGVNNQRGIVHSLRAIDREDDLMHAAPRTTSLRVPDWDTRLSLATGAFFARFLVVPWHAGVAALGFLTTLPGRRWAAPAVSSPASTGFVVVAGSVAVTALLPWLLHPLGGQGARLFAQSTPTWQRSVSPDRSSSPRSPCSV